MRRRATLCRPTHRHIPLARPPSRGLSRRTAPPPGGSSSTDQPRAAPSTSIPPQRSPKDIFLGFMKAIERGDAGEKLREHFDESFVQEEMPNRLNPKGQRSDLATVLRRSEQGKAMLRRQTYEVKSIISEGDHVAGEVQWTGELAVPFGKLQPGDKKVAHFAFFAKVRGGRLVSQRNYDCYEPWE